MTPLRGVLLAVAGALVLLLIVLRAVFPGALEALATPLWQLGTFATGKATFSKDAGTLSSEVTRLTEENRALSNENAALAARLADIGEAIGEGSAGGERGILAGVLARPPLSPYDALIVGKGTRNGVVPGMRAFSANVPVGVVESVSGGSARIALFSAAGRESEGWAGASRIPVTLVGEGAGAFTAEVAREAAIAAGDAVYLPGPGALPVGMVTAVESHPSSPRALLRIRPLVNPFSMIWVELVPSSPMPPAVVPEEAEEDTP